MTPRSLVIGGAVASVLCFLIGLVFFVRTQDAFVLMTVGRWIAGLWVILLIVHVILNGVPVRVVNAREP
jgi:fructose-specific phosphotransferase system IIC component